METLFISIENQPATQTMYSMRDCVLEWNHIDPGVVNCDEMSHGELGGTP